MTDEKIAIFNPDSEDFTVRYDIDGNKSPKEFTIHAQEIEHFEPSVAEHITKHLANYLLHKRGVKNNPEMDLAQIREEIRVEL